MNSANKKSEVTSANHNSLYRSEHYDLRSVGPKPFGSYGGCAQVHDNSHEENASATIFNESTLLLVSFCGCGKLLPRQLPTRNQRFVSFVLDDIWQNLQKDPS